MIVRVITAAPLMFLASPCFAALHTFHYSNNTTLVIEAPSREAGYRSAATICYKSLTHNSYIGDEASLDVIDICANPTN